MSEDWAIKIEHLSKVYKIFDKPTDRVKEALNPFRKRYSRDFYALNDVSLTIKKGETVGIIGKNGAGKSTILKIITGVLTPTSGSVQVNGRIASLLELGAGFNPEMTGIENIYMNGTIMGYSKEEMDDRLQDIVDFADIGEFIHQPVKMYSSGMFARLAFAVNVNVTPDILIVDEALSVGDVFFQNKCFKRMDALKKSGVTVLFVSHDMGSIRQLCDKCLWLENGGMRQYGNVEEIAAAYFNEQLSLQNKLNQDTVEDFVSNHDIDVFEGKKYLELPLISSKHGLMNDDVIIKSLSFYENGEERLVLENGHRYVARYAVEFKKGFENLIFGFVMENNKGIAVIGINSWMASGGKNIAIKKAGTAVVSFEFLLPKILQGTYTISLAVAQGNQLGNVQLTWLENTISIDIKNKGYNCSVIEIDSDVEVKFYSSEYLSYFAR